MIFAAVFAILGWIPPSFDDTRNVVEMLASRHSAEREIAQLKIEALGDSALPALLEATESPDLELRHRAAAVLDAIEGRQLSRPTLVSLNFQTKPLREVAETIGVEAGVTILFEPELDARLRDRSVTLQADQPVPLWSAIDRFCAANGFILAPPTSPGMRDGQAFAMGNGMKPRRRLMLGNELVFRPDPKGFSAPTSDTGAFRVSIAGLVLDRTRNFARSTNALNQQAATTQFAVTLQVRAEPRLTIASIDEPRLIEAIDDRGQSLLDTVPATTANRNFRRMDEFGRNQPLTVSLQYPAVAGQTIAKLKGSMRVLIVGRKPNPILIPLAQAEGKTYAFGSTALSVQSVRLGGVGRETVVDFTLEGIDGTNGGKSALNAFDHRAGLRPPPAAYGQIEFVDAKGRLCHVADLSGFNGNFGNINQRKLTFITLEPAGPPVEARYYSAVWSSVEVPFEFRQIPMP